MDEILTEVRRAREKIVAEHGGDLHKLCLAMRRREAQHAERVLDLSKGRQAKLGRRCDGPEAPTG